VLHGNNPLFLTPNPLSLMSSVLLKSWTVDEYHRMIAAGILAAGDRLELLDGQIIQMNPQLPPHAATTQRAARYLDRLLEEVAYVRMQLPVTLRPSSEPEPDIAVVCIDPNEYGDRHPTASDVLLLIEVADSTLISDRQKKALIYAKAGISDYWILDINSRQVLIFREPSAEGYRQSMTLTLNEAIAPLAFPNIEIPLTQLFLQSAG